MTKPTDILNFWFDEYGPEYWYKKDAAFDDAIRTRFGDAHKAASAGEYWQWRSSPQGRLAEIIVLDQFSRNLFREDGRAFAQDAMALALAQEAIHSGDDQKLNPQQRWMCYMPFMHSESLVIHDRAVELFTQLGNENALKYEHKHRNIIECFGRYPHRNVVLGRKSTPEEIEFLKDNSGF